MTVSCTYVLVTQIHRLRENLAAAEVELPPKVHAPLFTVLGFQAVLSEKGYHLFLPFFSLRLADFLTQPSQG